MTTTSGHVFVVRGDIRRLACDAWVMPSDGEGRVEPSWVAWPAGTSRSLGPAVPFPHWTREGRRVRRLEGWPTQLPEPWMMHVELDPLVPSSWLVEGMTAFVAAAALGTRTRRPRYGRTVPLLAVPVGVAGIGAADGLRAQRAAGALVQELLPELRRAAAEQGVDVAIVAHSDDSYAAAHVARQQEGGTRWDGLPKRLRDHLPVLAQAVARRALVLVIGPSLGERVGLPAWSRLMERLAEGAGATVQWRTALATLPEQERTQLVARMLGGTVNFGRAAAERLSLSHHGLSHGLASSLRADPLVSVAPDDLLDQACAAAGHPTDVIIDGPLNPGGPRMVKLVGSPQVPAALLWSRVDAAWRREREASLAAAVQAALPPDPHVLVAGFEPGPDLLRTLGPLAQVLPRSADPRITILSEYDDDALPTLLPAGTTWLPLVARRDRDRKDVRTAGRRLELALDALGGAAAVGGRFLDPALRALLPAADQALARALDDMVHGLSERARQGEGWQALRPWLAARGLPEE